MSLYDRIDHDVSSKAGEKVEFFFLYALCFAAMLIPAAIRRFGHRIPGEDTGSGRSLFRDARTMAANCAATSFMGM